MLGSRSCTRSTMMSECFGQLDLISGVDICPTIDGRAGCGRPYIAATSQHLGDSVILLGYSYRNAVVHLAQSAADVGLHHQTGPITAVEHTQLGVLRKETPDTVVMHRQGVHASSCRHAPDFHGLIRAGRHDRVASLVNQDRPHIVGMAHELRNTLA